VVQSFRFLTCDGAHIDGHNESVCKPLPAKSQGLSCETALVTSCSQRISDPRPLVHRPAPRLLQLLILLWYGPPLKNSTSWLDEIPNLSLAERVELLYHGYGRRSAHAIQPVDLERRLPSTPTHRASLRSHRSVVIVWRAGKERT
jgi:hypothetical protein